MWISFQLEKFNITYPNKRIRLLELVSDYTILLLQLRFQIEQQSLKLPTILLWLKKSRSYHDRSHSKTPDDKKKNIKKTDGTL